ncbi:E3 ubiquitin-protein ligase CIP8-like [Phoenix dactylifera]|uniref:E3 ubiquitin-protein ligase CIP8-like n=1 Tax=Phoenix dactylifera TaxID=42345 RepID=A0A8B9AEC9_PHODC|nr:E3 ubiquitin-protein ligase CIP8-like [Phoenix dactylifera]
MAMSESYNLGNAIVHMEARRVLAPQVQPQVVVGIRFTSFRIPADDLSIAPATFHRFHLVQIPLPTALPSIVSSVVARLHGVHGTVRRFCNDRILRFSSLAAAQMMDDGSALELLVHVGLLLGQRGSDEDFDLMLEWMMDNPPEEEEEMADAVFDYYVYEDDDAGHGGFGGVPASGSFIEGLQRFAYGRGDGAREERCMICLEEFDAPAAVSKTPCSHAFHSQCIIQWLEKSHLCPICRYQMPTASSS